MEIEPLRRDLKEFLAERNLEEKWEKAVRFFLRDIRHPSLHTELLKPRWRGIYSFRIDRKYRALFFVAGSKAEVFQMTNHYKKH